MAHDTGAVEADTGQGQAAAVRPDGARPIGVFDSGVGGLTVARAIRAALPSERVVYVGDTARVPYGGKSAATVTRYSLEIAAALIDEGAKCIVIACNTASALAIEALRAIVPVPVVGVVKPGAATAAGRSRTGRIGVVGTRATVASGAYQAAIRAINPDATVIAAACPLFVPLVEEMWIDDEVTRAVIARYLNPLLSDEIDTLLLGCTHYPFLADAIRSHCGSRVEVVDSAVACADSLAAMIHRGDLPAAPAGRAGSLEPILTDAPDRFLEMANRRLGLDIDPDAVRVVPPDALVASGLAAAAS